MTLLGIDYPCENRAEQELVGIHEELNSLNTGIRDIRYMLERLVELKEIELLLGAGDDMNLVESHLKKIRARRRSE